MAVVVACSGNLVSASFNKENTLVMEVRDDTTPLIMDAEDS